GDDGESVVLLALLSLRRLVAVEAVDALLRMLAHLVFVHDGILRARVTVGALAGGADELRAGLLRLDGRAGPVGDESGADKGKRDGDRDEDGAEGHVVLPPCGARQSSARREVCQLFPPKDVMFVTRSESREK